MTSKFLKLPDIGEYVRNLGKLVAIEEIPPKEPERDYIIETVEARCDLFWNEGLLKNLQTLNDFYGEGTGVEIAIKEMKEYATKGKVTSDSEIEVRVTKVVSQRRMRPISRENFYAKGYHDFETLEWGSLRTLPEPIESIVWSSKGK